MRPARSIRVSDPSGPTIGLADDFGEFRRTHPVGERTRSALLHAGGFKRLRLAATVAGFARPRQGGVQAVRLIRKR